MKHRRLVINAVLLAAAMLGQFAVATATRHRAPKQTRFTVRVENISTPNGQTASDGTKWSFALSPGLWVLHDKKSGLFTEGKLAVKGLKSDGSIAPTEGSNQALAVWAAPPPNRTWTHNMSPAGCTACSIRPWE